ncbi:hypothetical protein TSUD_307020 [Trifolium subterraneum]|uniref:Uncharacterized protein n=1 Tax=Trifolium subterraneum TaxID=3900 RepID=A0A2Z6NE44_TRISU|nr:hypothetical protein TSUD_307020 [Trifolium subterraneum]
MCNVKTYGAFAATRNALPQTYGTVHARSMTLGEVPPSKWESNFVIEISCYWLGYIIAECMGFVIMIGPPHALLQDILCTTILTKKCSKWWWVGRAGNLCMNRTLGLNKDLRLVCYAQIAGGDNNVGVGNNFGITSHFIVFTEDGLLVHEYRIEDP